MILRRQQRIDLVELPDVVRAVVGRKSDAAQHHFAPACCSGVHDLSRLARVLAMGSPRRPSLPPNSTITTAGFKRKRPSSRSTPSLVVLPLIP